MPDGHLRKKTPFRGTGGLFAPRLVARAANFKPDEATQLNHHVATIDSLITMPTENGQRQKGQPATCEGPWQTEARPDQGNATKQKSGAATPEERVAKEKGALAA